MLRHVHGGEVLASLYRIVVYNRPGKRLYYDGSRDKDGPFHFLEEKAVLFGTFHRAQVRWGDLYAKWQDPVIEELYETFVGRRCVQVL